MMNLSREFTELFSCMQLAVFCELCGGSNFADEAVERQPGRPMSDVAFHVLRQWKREKPDEASAATLCRILKHKLKWEQTASELADGKFA